jgi:LacI family transcriptional regulator
VTAIAALNDSMAVGALAHLRGVDRRISVIGFDDMPIARDVTPALTTIRLPLADMGALAMSLALAPRSTEPRVERVPAQLVERESTAPPD